MTGKAYYNEFDPFAAAWLRELIRAGHIAPGDVDERSIEDVRPDDLRGYTQCHFFAGIGVWSYALRRAGWADDRPIWTGSCPCQPFSAAGKGGGFADERHLWPAFFHLIGECRPAVVLGEQVASKDGLGWLDLVSSDLEGADYAVGAVDTCSAGFGAPHIRQRLWWSAYDQRPAAGRMADRNGRERGWFTDGERGQSYWPTPRRVEGDGESERRGAVDRVGLSTGGGRKRVGHQSEYGEPVSAKPATGGMADVPGSGRREERSDGGWIDARDRAQGLAAGSGAGSGDLRPGPANGFWRDADWLFCRDGKWRPVEPGTFPLAHGAPARVGRLRGYGNAINAEAATAFVEAYLEARHTVDA